MQETEQKINKIKLLKSIFGHLHSVKKAKWKIGGLMALYIATIASEPYFYKILMDALEKELKTPLGLIPESIVIIIGIWLIITIAAIGARYLFGMVLLTHQHKDWEGFLLKSMKKMLLLPIDYHIGVQHGEKQKIIDRGAEAVWQAGDNLLLKVVPQICISIILIIIGLTIDIRMTLISLTLLPISIGGVVWIGKRAHTNQRAANKLWDKAFGRIGDSFTNLNITRIFDRGTNEIKILSDRFHKGGAEQQKVRKLWVGFNSFGQAFVFVAKVFVLSMGVIFIYQGSMGLGTLLFFLAFADRVYGPIFSVFESYQNMMLNIAHYEKIEAIFAMDNEKNNGKKILEEISKSIQFKNISFSYPSSDREVLTNIEFEIKKGERIALVGQTGSGKSTIIQLLMRFYEPRGGKILIDGTDIYDFTLESYRSKFAAVFQDTTLFNETIRHNLEYIRDNITQENLEKACKEANILDFIESLTDGWETQVGERGLKLSGGEKQRIAIARAILANPEILILDEATSALDTKTEKLVQEAFDHLMIGRTSIIIAHRLSTIMSADTIYLMEKGKILAKGSHQELYEISKEYREMVDLQHDGIICEEDEEEELNS
ncbi:ABC transporter ATP-binding protein [Candidatus Gracilibacteria bacterium]|nr:ABC transporter ATP-binding protein [Candidatus Gracilibacteria bacterium]